MNKLSRHRVLIAGLLAPFAAFVCYQLVYVTLTWRSHDIQHDWLFRLCVSTPAMAIPFLFTLLLFLRDRRRGPFLVSAKVGLLLSILSIGFAASPIRDGVLRARQERNMAMRGVPAPLFETVDIFGNSHRLADLQGQVILVNIWATWCQPCRAEMPKLNQLFLERKDKGLIVFGISDEDVSTQQNFLRQVPVIYPLLTLQGQVPAFYRDIARYPAIFLIDRRGHLQPAPPPSQPFSSIQSLVDSLLAEPSF